MKKSLLTSFLTLAILSISWLSYSQNTLTITSPNGGESLVGGDNHNITWNSSGSIANVDLFYSLDNGNTFNFITDNLPNTGSFVWSLPFATSSQCQLIIFNTADANLFDVSNANFSIGAASPITLNSPNGGESWNASSTNSIAWTTSGITNVKLEYSLDNGSSWTNIIASTAASTGIYNWTVPSVSSTNCKIRISDATNSSINDVSDTTFTIIGPSINLVSPNGGEIWQSGNTEYIYWSSQSASSYVKISYSINSGNTWQYAAGGNGASNNGTFAWSVPNSPSSNCKIKVEDYYTNTILDISDSNFTIKPAPATLTLTTPNGGQTYSVGSSQYIYWSFTNVNAVKIEFSSDNGVSWNLIKDSTNASLGNYYWQNIPNTPSNLCRVKVSDQSNNSLSDISNATFSIIGSQITVATPNGGEVFNGAAYNVIYWASQGSISNVKIDYSLNNGSSWTTIVNGASNNGQFNWNTPNVSSSNCLIKISDYYNNNIADSSNAVFTIEDQPPFIAVTSPNGYENWTIGSYQYIYWSSTNLASVNIKLSTNNGATFTTIASNITASNASYYWQVASLPSTNCLIKIEDANDSTYFDISDLKFTISTPFITLISPNGGEVYAAGSSQYFYWNSNITNGYVKIYYSTDNGSTWTLAVNGANNNGAYPWSSIPNTPSITCKIRITDYYTPSIIDESDANFTITGSQGTLSLTTPNGGQYWIIGSSEYIYWNQTNTNNVKLEYSTNGTTWDTIVSNTSASTGYYYWQNIPNTPSATCLVRITDVTNSSNTDISNGVFTIGTPYITVTEPNGSESYVVGSTKAIKWNTAGTGSAVKIDYTTNNGVSWTTLVSTASNSGTYSWTVAALPSTLCKVRITDAFTTSITDMSDARFNINGIGAGTIQVTTPNGGESYSVGGNQGIYWNYSAVNDVKIDYSTDGGTTYTTIMASTPAANQYYNWTSIPNTPSTNCKVKISSVLNPSTVSDQSDSKFTILTPSVTVLSPNGGETIPASSMKIITWNSVGLSAYVKIYYSLNNGTTWAYVSGGNGADNTGSFNWNVVSTQSTTCLIKIEDYYTTSITDNSDATFTIGAPSPTINITSPNGGQSWQQGSTQYITWSSTSVTNVNVEYTLNNGSSWTNIVSNYSSTGSYSWSVPNTPSAFCKVRITDASNSTVKDISDNVFSITNPMVNVVSPNGGEVWAAGTTHNIYWTHSGLSTYVRIWYSLNNGASYTNLINGATNNGNYAWAISSSITPSTQCRIKVADYNNNNIYDISDTTFSIGAAAPTINLTTPNGGNVWNVGSSQYIYWTASGINKVKLEYSVNNGSSWATIIDSTTASTGYYQWTNIPNTPSTNCKVRVSNAYNSSLKDLSDNLFTINLPYMIVTAPNGGEQWNAGTTQTITYVSSGFSSNVKIDYSIDSMLTWTTIVNGASNNGSYSYSFPNSPSTRCFVRVMDYYNPTTMGDTSDFKFTIKAQTPTISVTTPNGGQNWVVGSNQYIYWSSAAISANVKIEYTANNGSTWNSIVTSTSASTGYYYWSNIPNTPSTQCKVRVSDAANTNTYDISNSNFTISAPTITVTSPNGGEVWYTTSAHYIYWSQSGLSSAVKIYYKTSNGGTWNLLANGVTNSGSYYWSSIPNSPSTQCKVKITDFTTTSISDTSNSNFTIAVATPTVTLTYPNGGQNFIVGATKNITWSSANIANVKLEYSTNNGSTWKTIISSTNAANASYAWLVPNDPSTQCKVRVTDVSNSIYFDESNNVFTIAAPYLNLTSPNGGQTWAIGSTQSISWSSSGVTSVKIEYSVNNGASYTVLTSSYTGSAGSYAWLIPNSPSCSGLIRITDVSNTALNDISTSAFCLVTPSISITKPNGGESFAALSTQTIAWTSTYTSSYVTILYSLNNGASWNNVSTYTDNDGSFNWSVPNNISSQCLVRICDYSNTSNCDVSNAVFSIVAPAPSVTVTAPNGYENLVIGSTKTITWNSVSISNVKIKYSINNGATYTTIIASTSASSGSYNWTVPNTPSVNCKVKITSASDSTVSDVSNNNFSINVPYITVTTPNGGQNWTVGSTQNIYWNSAGVTGNVLLEYSINNGAVWDTIVLSTLASTGYYSWIVPNSPSANCRIKIIDKNNTATFDVSDNVFTIAAPTLTLTSPNGGQTYSAGTSQGIYWSSQGISNVKVEYSTNNGSSWIVIVGTTVASNGYYNWTIPTSVVSCNMLIRVTDANNSSLTDQSNSTFCIINPTITLTAPNGGESWMANTSKSITWTSTGVSSYVKLEYSTNSGTSWSTITNNAYNNGSYNWTVANNVTTTAKVRITDNNLSTITDLSDANFNIIAQTPTITVTAPNGGESWPVGSTKYITWNSTSVSNVKIEYSINNGASYTTVVSSTGASAGSYAWIIPNTSSIQAKVKISDASNVNLFDVSNTVFTIPSATITLTTPNGGEVWGTGTSHYIYWNSVSVQNVKLEYTSNNGTIWNTIISSTSGAQGYYNWMVPNNPSSNCKVRVSSALNNAVSDISNNLFTIGNPTITVTAPNGGESLVGLSNRTITWTSSALSSYVNIDYSIDNAATWSQIASGASNSGTYIWNVSNTPSSQCKVRVSDYYTSSWSDISNGSFTIIQATPSITLSAPNGGENWLVGSSHYIYWSSTSVQNVLLEYTYDNGLNWSIINSSVAASNGYYYWIVPNTPGANCKVRASDVSNSQVIDISNSKFIISQPVPSLTMDYPNGGENFLVGSYQTIRWSANAIANIKLEVSLDAGSTWNVIEPSLPASQGSYYTGVGNSPSTTCLLRVTDVDNVALYDASNAIFSISTPIVNNNTLSTDTIAILNHCKGDSIVIGYHATGVYNAGNIFSAQLSDTSGSFSNPIGLAGLTTTDSIRTFTIALPTSMLNGNNYRIRVVSSDLPVTGSDNGKPIKVNSPEFDFSVPGNQLIKYLPDGRVNFTNTLVDTAGASYLWKFGNGDSSIAMNPNYDYNAIGFYTVSLKVTSSAGCMAEVVKSSYLDIEQIFPTIPTPPDTAGNDLNGVSMLNAFTGIAVGNNGTVSITNDGGVTWSMVANTGINGNITSVYVLDSLNAFATTSTGNIVRSPDGGLSWTNIYTGSNALNAISFKDNVTGFAVGANGLIVKIVYATNSWSATTVGTTGISTTCNAVAFAGAKTFCVDATGKIYASATAGQPWVAESYVSSVSLNAMAFYDNGTTTIGYAVGNNGTIVKYDGSTWTEVYNGLGSNFMSVQIEDDSTIYAVGEDGIVYVTRNGGGVRGTNANWVRYSIGSTSANLRGMSVKASKGIIIGNAGSGYRFGGPGLGLGSVDTSYCAGQSFDLEYFVSGTFGLNNSFAVELSDKTGGFSTPTTIGAVSSNILGTIRVVIPTNAEAGSAYRLRLTSTDTALVSEDNGTDIRIRPAPQVNLGVDTGICAGSSLTLNAGFVGSTYLWNVDSTTQTITIKNSGGYAVHVTNNGCTGYDSIYVEVTDTLDIDFGTDITACSGSSTITLNPNVNGATYTWNTGATTPTIDVTTAGTYSLSATKCAQTKSDTISIVFLTTTVKIGNDTTVCPGSTVTLNAGNSGASYLWSTESYTQSISVTTSGLYSVIVTKSGCAGYDTANVVVLPILTVSLGKDTNICASNVTLTPIVSGSGATYLWSNSSTSPTINVTKNGTYYVSASRCNASKTDTIKVDLGAPKVFIGKDTAFCKGTIVLNAGNPGSSYSWSTGAITQSINVDTLGTFIANVSNCGHTTTDTIKIKGGSAGPKPVITQIENTLSATPIPSGITYAWFKGRQGVGSPLLVGALAMYTPPTSADTGWYYLVIRDVYCTTITDNFYALGIGFAELGSANGVVKLYPNPSRGQFSVEFFAKPSVKVEITVSNILGEEVLSKSPKCISGKNIQHFSLEDESVGIYFVRVKIDDQISTQRIIISK